MRNLGDATILPRARRSCFHQMGPGDHSLLGARGAALLLLFVILSFKITNDQINNYLSLNKFILESMALVSFT